MSQLRLALRRLLKTPLVTAIAVVSLALGIGANTAIFSMFDQMLLRKLPVPRAGCPREPQRTGTEARVAVEQRRGFHARRLQLPDVSRPRAGADDVHRTGRAPWHRREPGLPWRDQERSGNAGLGQLFRRARPPADGGPPADARRRPRPRAPTPSSCSATSTGSANSARAPS